MSSDKTVGISSVSNIYHWLRGHGADLAQLEQDVGISLSMVNNAEGRISFDQLVQVWDWAIQYSKDPSLGIHIGRKVDPSLMSIVAQAFFNNDNLRQGMELYQRFYCLINDSGSVELKLEKSNAVLEFSTESDEYYCIPEMERTLTAAVARARYFLGDSVSPKEMLFQHNEPTYKAVYEEFFNSPVKFNQSRTAIFFDPAYLDLKMDGSNPFLFQALTQYAEGMLQKLYPNSKTDSIADKVEVFIKQHLAMGELDLKAAAANMHMSRNSLYRKLKKEGLSFKTMLDDIRHQEALRYLRETDHHLSEVAFFLGFSELSAFSRAFKRWTGKSPQLFRQQEAED